METAEEAVTATMPAVARAKPKTSRLVRRRRLGKLWEGMIGFGSLFGLGIRPGSGSTDLRCEQVARDRKNMTVLLSGSFV
jgi:hypothetical protein